MWMQVLTQAGYVQVPVYTGQLVFARGTRA